MYSIVFNLTQAITNSGSISADWVLVGITGLCGTLIIVIVVTIKNNLKETIAAQQKQIDKLSASSQKHGEEIIVCQKDILYVMKEIKEESEEMTEIKKNFVQVISKLKFLNRNDD